MSLRNFLSRYFIGCTPVNTLCDSLERHCPILYVQLYRSLICWMHDAALWLPGCLTLHSNWLDAWCRTVIGWMLDAAMSDWLMWCVGEERADGDGDPPPESRLWALPLHAGHHGLHRGLCSGENKNKSYLFLLVPVWYVCLRDSVARFPPPLFLSYLTQLGPWLTC